MYVKPISTRCSLGQGLFNNAAAANNGNSGNIDDRGENRKIAEDSSIFEEKGVYPECVAGRSTFCKATIVVDYIEYSKDEIN